MKKYYNIILSIIYLILWLINSWYADELAASFSIFYMIPSVIIFNGLFIWLLIVSINKIFKDKQYINIISIAILIVIFLLGQYFPFRELKVKFELNKYEQARMEIIGLIVKNEELLEKDEAGNVILPDDYKKYSATGEVTIYQNDENGQVIGFWVFRGMQSGSVELIYSTGGEELIKANETGHPIISIEKLKDNWYYVITDY